MVRIPGVQHTALCSIHTDHCSLHISAQTPPAADITGAAAQNMPDSGKQTCFVLPQSVQYNVIFK